jgi:hypothetical protein
MAIKIPLIEKDSGTGFVSLNKDLHPNFIINSVMPIQGESAVRTTMLCICLLITKWACGVIW